MNSQVVHTLKTALVWVMLVAVLVCTTLSVMGIWEVIHARDVVWRAISTLGVIFFGSAISLIVLNVSQTRLFPPRD